MTLSGTAAHNRCIVIRLPGLHEGSWASPPNAEHRSSCCHGLWSPRYQARPKDRCALRYRERSPKGATLLLWNASAFRSGASGAKCCFFSSLQRHRVCEGRREPSLGTGRTGSWSGWPSWSTLDYMYPLHAVILPVWEHWEPQPAC